MIPFDFGSNMGFSLRAASGLAGAIIRAAARRRLAG